MSLVEGLELCLYGIRKLASEISNLEWTSLLSVISEPVLRGI